MEGRLGPRGANGLYPATGTVTGPDGQTFPLGGEFNSAEPIDARLIVLGGPDGRYVGGPARKSADTETELAGLGPQGNEGPLDLDR